ncbi:LysR substrate-binding domain-containing protein [Ralstonia sp. L16]|uniref:LysR substrate-binding domain-containing protein n=1 Tax=Ralstonia sp. L16 TaxID=3423950 RepID=UPI003F7923A1
MKPTLTTNSLASLKNHVRARRALTFMSERAVAKEVGAHELVTVRIANPVLEAAQIQLVVRAEGVASSALIQLQKTLSDMPLFG